MVYGMEILTSTRVHRLMAVALAKVEASHGPGRGTLSPGSNSNPTS